MRSQIVGLRVAGAIFGIVCLLHIVRLIAGIPMTFGSLQFNTPSTVIAVLVTGFLGIWLWTLSVKK